MNRTRGSVKLSGLAREAVDRWTTSFVVGSVKLKTFEIAAWTYAGGSVPKRALTTRPPASACARPAAAASASTNALDIFLIHEHLLSIDAYRVIRRIRAIK